MLVDVYACVYVSMREDKLGYIFKKKTKRDGEKRKRRKRTQDT